MKILVAIKKVPDYQAKIKVKADGQGIETDNIKWIVNPFDEIAVEEALKIKEAGKASEVVVVSTGSEDTQNQLRYCMAMGADRAILVKSDQTIDSQIAADVITKIYQREEFSLIIMGKQAIDSDASQTAQIVAANLNLPQACFASKVEFLDASTLHVTREVDGGLETLKLSLPCVISTDLRLNTPRYASLPGIMKAKKKPLEELNLTDLIPDASLSVKVLRMSAPQSRSAGKKVDSVEQLVKALKEEAKVI